MFAEKNNNTTSFYAYASTNKQSNKEDAERKIDNFVSMISSFDDVIASEKRHCSRNWEDIGLTDYVFVKITYPKTIADSIWSVSRKASVTLSVTQPLD